jgi:hypothetical protein
MTPPRLMLDARSEGLQRHQQTYPTHESDLMAHGLGAVRNFPNSVNSVVVPAVSAVDLLPRGSRAHYGGSGV